MSPVCREARWGEIPPHSYFANKTSVAFTWETGWPGSVGSHCQLPRSRHGGSDIFSCKHVIPARWDENITTAHAFVYPLHRWWENKLWINTRQRQKSYFKNLEKSERKPVYFQKTKCFYSYTTRKLFSSDKYLSEASLLKISKTSVFWNVHSNCLPVSKCRGNHLKRSNIYHNTSQSNACKKIEQKWEDWLPNTFKFLVLLVVRTFCYWLHNI